MKAIYNTTPVNPSNTSILTVIFPEMVRLYKQIADQHKMNIYPNPEYVSTNSYLMNMGFRWLGHDHKSKYKLAFNESTKDGSILIYIWEILEQDDPYLEYRIVQKLDIGCSTFLDDIRHVIHYSLENYI